MKKKMVHRLFILLTHASSVHRKDVPLPEIIHDKDLTKGCQPSEKGLPRRADTVPREAASFTKNQGAIEEFNLKRPSFGGDPSLLIFTSLSHSS